MHQILIVTPKGRKTAAWTPSDGLPSHEEGFFWLDLHQPTREEMDTVTGPLKLSPQVMRAATSPDHRAYVRVFDDHLLLVLNVLGRGPSDNGKPQDPSRWRLLEFDVVLGTHFVITVHQEAVMGLTMLMQRIVKERTDLDSGQLLHVISDTATTGFTVLMDQFDRQVETAEEAIFAGKASPATVAHLFAMKKLVLRLRRSLGRQRDALAHLARLELPWLEEHHLTLYEEVYERNLRLFDLLDSYRDLLSSSLDAYMSMSANRMNDVMKTLTAVSTILLPLTLISGIFGMNFVEMPWIEEPWGFAASMGLMGAVAAVTIWVVVRRGWLK